VGSTLKKIDRVPAYDEANNAAGYRTREPEPEVSEACSRADNGSYDADDDSHETHGFEVHGHHHPPAAYTAQLFSAKYSPYGVILWGSLWEMVMG
jgi:hypothetical protein